MLSTTPIRLPIPLTGTVVLSTNNGYMRKHLREWMIWYKKQTGFNGIRIDAVKHFQNEVSRDFLWNLQNLAGWATASDTMLAVGEWVGGKTELDNWTWL